MQNLFKSSHQLFNYVEEHDDLEIRGEAPVFQPSNTEQVS